MSGSDWANGQSCMGRQVSLKLLSAQRRYDFDSTCGFPGEGPVERDLTFATLNVSGIGTLWKHIEDTVFDQPQVLLAQEHRQIW